MKPITIIGGGLAGLTLGILLRRERIPVAIVEAGKYPRHRVCGEFLSGRGRDILRTLGVEEKIPRKREASTCSFHVKGRSPISFQLDSPALCVSRFDLDAVLADEFQNAGGILKTGERADLGTDVEGVVSATGRRRSSSGAGRLFGLKAHAVKPAQSTDLELHFGPQQYVGVCRLSGERANVSGLFFSKEPVRTIQEKWKEIFQNLVSSHALDDVEWDEHSFCSVAGLTLDRDAPSHLFSIGDAAAMTPPLTGNGMSMAFESASLAFPFLQKYSSGDLSWRECMRDHSAAWRQEFSSRLRWAEFVQRMVFQSTTQRLMYFTVRLLPALPSLLFSRTR